MIINSLKLNNIRSYESESISFPKGAVLLSGDIGCGKTTVLLALEFAIFGIMKGVLTGNTLLRHGSDRGSVELSFNLEEKNIIIKRSLKRSGSGVVQDSGSISINNNLFEGTTQEIKSRVLALLGYPEELLSKSKSLVFRYTVFTPQEEMKRILYEKKEDRLDILRRLFNIDKYKRIKDNCVNYIRDIRTKINFISGKIEVLPNKNNLEEYVVEINSLKEEVAKQQNSLKEVVDDFDKAKFSFEKQEEKLELIKKAENDFKIKENSINSLKNQLSNDKNELSSINESIQKFLSELQGLDLSKIDELKSGLEKKKEELKKIEDKEDEIVKKKSEFEYKKHNSEKIINDVKELDNCPTCLQKVPETHINDLTGRNTIIISKCDNNLQTLNALLIRVKDKKQTLKIEIDQFIQGEKEFVAKKIRLESLNEKKEKKILVENNIKQKEEKIIEENISLELLKEKTLQISKEKDELIKFKSQLEEKRNKKFSFERIVAEKSTRLNTIIVVKEKLEQEIKELLAEESKLKQLTIVKNSLQEEFISLVDVMEKSILSKIYTEFNSFFQEWFNTLLEDETISVRLDEYFSPIIEQNGHETWIENLSGGEKTSIALAYRLALNKVINDFLSSINTKSLLILDEPTEGFSSDQLDRVREVLNQSNSEQIIIVSHEAKMEGFVDNIIRITKQGHESRVLKA